LAAKSYWVEVLARLAPQILALHWLPTLLGAGQSRKLLRPRTSKNFLSALARAN
jgi:hypothetical protein